MENQVLYVKNLIQNLGNAKNTQSIADAEKQINDILNYNYSEVMSSLIAIFMNESESINIRKSSAILFKNNLNNLNVTYKWLDLDSNIRTEIKNNLLATLGTNNYDLVKLVSACISSITKVEFPLNQWKNIFEVLLNVLNSNKDLMFIRSSLTAMEYILQDIRITDLSDQEVEFIYSSVFISKNNLLEIIKSNHSYSDENIVDNFLLSYTKIIKELIRFSKDIFKSYQKQEYILEMLFSSVLAYNYELKISGLQGLNEAYKYWYKTINSKYYSKLMLCSENIMANTKKLNVKENAIIVNQNNENVIIYDNKLAEALIDLWNIIANHEKILTKYASNSNSHFIKPFNNEYCFKGYEIMTSYVFDKFLTTEDIDEDDWDVVKSGFTLLISFSKTCPVEFIIQVLGFVKENYHSNNLVIKKRSLLAFSSILEAGLKKTIYEYIKNGLDDFFELISVDFLRETSGITIERVFGNFSSELVNKINVQTYLDKMIDLLFIFFKTDVKFAISIANAISSLTKEIPNKSYDKFIINEEKLNNILSICLSVDLNNFTQIDQNFADSLFLCLSYILYNMPIINYGTLTLFFNTIVEKIKQSIVNIQELLTDTRNMLNNNMYLADNKYIEKIIFIQNNLLLLIKGIINSKVLNFNKEDYEFIFNLIISCFNSQGRVCTEGLFLINDIFQILDANSFALYPTFKPFLIHGLNLYSSSSAISNECLSSVALLVDLIPHSIFPDTNIYLEICFEIILTTNANVEKNLKSLAFEVLSDLLPLNKELAHSYTDKVVSLINFALIISSVSKEDLVDYDETELCELKKLQSSLLINLLTIFREFSLNDFNLLYQQLNLLFERICTFIVYINDYEDDPDLFVVGLSINLIIDLLQLNTNLVKNTINKDVLLKLILLLKNNEDYLLIANHGLAAYKKYY